MQLDDWYKRHVNQIINDAEKRILNDVTNKIYGDILANSQKTNKWKIKVLNWKQRIADAWAILARNEYRSGYD